MPDSHPHHTDDICIYIDNKALWIKSDRNAIGSNDHMVNFTAALSIFDIIKWISENHLNYFLVTDDTQMALQHFKNQIKLIQAGGGLVQNPKGDFLFIYRRGKWDLPKGKKEENENDEECAVREVEEETGITGIHDVAKICNTYHIYVEDAVIVMKETFWFLMKAEDQILIPQEEEGIKKAEWMNQEQLRRVHANTYPSVKFLVKNFIELSK
jgi:8-oxo-(d)GTP phosphatase